MEEKVVSTFTWWRTYCRDNSTSNWKLHSICTEAAWGL